MRETTASGTQLSFLHSDHLASTSVTANASGDRTAELRYKPWGETRTAYGTTPTSFTFTGQRVESKLGLHFYNARWYDSQLGRFVQADTVVPLQSQGTQAWDRYAYVNNNPIRFNDPSGHAADAGGADTCTDEELYEAYVALAQRTDPSSWDGWLREYYYNVAVYHLERSRGISENIEVSWAHFEHARDSLYINGYGTLDLAISTAWETAAPDTMIGAVQMVSAGAGVVGSFLTSNFSSPKKLLEHFQKHRAEFGYQSVDEYLQGARVLTSGGKGIETFMRVNGDTLFYNTTTNEFGVLRNDGIIRTYFKPVEGIDYWFGQIGK